jgi:lipopolysaccharide transport system permease protein
MSIYTYVFSTVVKFDHGLKKSNLPYAIYILSGLIPWLAFSESLSKSATIIRANSSLIKQVIFPVEIIPLIPVITTMITQMIFWTIFYGLVIYFTGLPPVTYLLMPILLFFQFLAMAGFAYIISAISVYFKDIKEVIQAGVMVMVYILPIFYLPEVLPAKFKVVLALNPLSYAVYCFQDVFYFNLGLQGLHWFIFVLGSIFIFYFGFYFFNKVRPYFGSHL